MKHGFRLPKLSRDPDKRWNMIRQLVTHLFEHERIHTTYTRAMALRRYAERTISKAKRGSEKGREQVYEIVTKPTIAEKVCTVLAERYRNRPGGYTRVWKIGWSQDDYRNPMAFIELVDSKNDLRKQFTRLAETMKAKQDAITQSQ